MASTPSNPSRDLVFSLVEKMLASPQFANAELQVELFNYLVKCSLSGTAKDLTDAKIAAEVFDLDESPAAIQQVRAEIRRLRSRLRDFEESHPTERYALHIPRSSCELVLRKRTDVAPLRHRRIERSPYKLIALLFAAALAAGAVLAGTLWIGQYWESHSGFETLTAIAGDINHFSLDPRARRIVFSGSIKPGGPSSIYILDASGGQPARLTSSAASEIYPAWSKSGKSIAFFRALEDHTVQLIVRDASSGLERIIANSPFASRPAWSPAGVALYVPLPSEESPMLAIHRVDLTSLQKQRITEVDPRSFGDRSPAISPDGKWLAWFRDSRPAGEIWMSAIDGSEPRRLLRFVTGFRGIDWTPDSRFIIGAFSSDWKQSLWRIDRNSGELAPVDVGHPDVWFPAYAHSDGKLIFLEAPAQVRLFDIDVARGQFKPINLVLPGLTSASRSPDGKSMALFAPNPVSAHYHIASMNGDSPRPISTLGLKGFGAPAWEPSGKNLVISALDPDQYHLHLLSASGGEARRLLTGNAAEFDPIFSPDGKTLYFLSDRDGDWDVWRVAWPIEDEPVQVTQGGVRLYHPTPDGKHLLLAHSRSAGLWQWDLQTNKEELLLGYQDFPSRSNFLTSFDSVVAFSDPYGRGSCCSVELIEMPGRLRRSVFHFDSMQFQPESVYVVPTATPRFLMAISQQQTASLRRVSLQVGE